MAGRPNPRGALLPLIHATLSLAAATLASLTAWAGAPTGDEADAHLTALVDRLTWGVTGADLAAIRRVGKARWLQAQLHPPPGDRLPPEVQARIDAMPYVSLPMTQLVIDARAQDAAANAIVDAPLKAAARQLYGKTLDEAAQEAAARSLLRDLYSPSQLREQMSWFWLNHFNVHLYKANLRLMVGDYEDEAIRPHALGRFRDLLEATLRHPAMLRYLDNADNATGRINENYAREIMELHTMGVGSGYSQKDVQELARILTGVGIDANPADPKAPPALRGQLIRSGLFEFNPARHDYGDKVFLGQAIRGRGFAEVEEALDILSRQPATAHRICLQLAAYFVSDTPPDALVQRMSRTFLRTDGDIAKVLETLFQSPEFEASLSRESKGGRFKDPAHYVISAVRLAYGGQPVTDTGPILSWLGRMGEGLYRHETPDGYSLTAASWDGPGQMATRFEFARQLGSTGAGLIEAPSPGAPRTRRGPDIQAQVKAAGLAGDVDQATRTALAQAVSAEDWNTLFLASPGFMRR